jgi:sugar transferase (PEP-CTERM/EpsH1 system associated)
MKILYICHRFPFPPRRGGKIRPFNMIRHFAHTHEVTVCSLVRSETEAKEGEGLSAYCKHYEMVRVHDSVQSARMLARLPSSLSSSAGFFHSPELARRIRNLAARDPFDLIMVHCAFVAHYITHLRDTPKIMDFGDFDSQKWRDYARYKPIPLSWGYALEARKLEREEARIARQFDLCTATTRAEWETLEAMGTATATDWFPNGVDAEYFAPADRPYDPDRIVFVGRMDYYPNQQCMFEFCAKVMPRLRERRPATTLAIVGADPTPAVRELGRLPGVMVTGSVPDVRPYLHDAALMVAPLNIARGTQNKILEGMAAGVPVVSSVVAAGGVDARAPDHLLTAATPAAYVDAILRVLDDPSERTRLSRAGRARMLSHHAWPQSMRRLDGIVERCLSRRRPVRALAAMS